MFRSLNNRLGHYLFLVAIAALLIFPNLGRPSLWDIDEGNNSEAAREMMESEDWIVPKFNYQLRVDKPALLYWLQIGAYRLFGINEFAARFPSALAALLTVLLAYELARGMFGAATGLLAGMILAGSGGFCASAHFANPDALLHFCTVLTLLLFWRSYKECGRGWFVPAGIVSGFAVLAKGPVGLLLPLGVVGFFLVSSRQLRVLFDRRMVWGGLAFGLVALPWYIWVANETKADFLRGFLGTHNLNRFLSPLENHRGPFYYYMAVLAVGFAPWSIFLALMGWYGTGDRARRDNAIGANDNRFPAVYRFLWCWILVYLVFFSLAATKLPNYILPIYAPLAVLTARFLDRWRRREIAPPGWLLGLSLSCLLLIGLATSLGLFVVGGRIDLAQLHGRQLLGLEAWAFLGAMPAFAAVAGWWCLRRKICTEMIAIMAIMSILFLGTLAAYGSIALDTFKAPRYLVEASGARDTRREIRVGCYEYFQPSLVFYCRREVQRLESAQAALAFLRTPLPVYLFVPASDWQSLEPKVRGSHHLRARHYDLYQHCEIVVVTNQ